MSVNRMPVSILQRQNDCLVLLEIVLRQLHLAIKYRDQVFRFQLLRRRCIRTVTFQAKRIDLLRPQQVFVRASMRFVANRARLPKHRLMQVRLLELVRLLAVTRQASAHWIRLQESWSLPRMRIVARDALALRSRMRNLSLVDLLYLIAVAGRAKRPRIRIRQHDLAVFGWRMAHLAGPFGKWRMRESLHQLRLRRLMRIMALRAVRCAKRLPLVRLDQGSILDVMAIDAQRRNRLGQVSVELLFTALSDLVRRVTGVATHIERSVTTPFFGDVQAFRMAIETEVFSLVSISRFEQLKLVIGSMRIVALDAVADRGRMNRAFERRSILICMTRNAERLRSGRDQLDARDVFVDPDLVAAQASHGDCGMDELALGLLLMTLKTFGGIDVLFQGHWVDGGVSAWGPKPGQRKQKQASSNSGKPAAFTGNLFSEPYARGNSNHTASRNGCARKSPYHRKTLPIGASVQVAE